MGSRAKVEIHLKRDPPSLSLSLSLSSSGATPLLEMEGHVVISNRLESQLRAV